MSENNPFFLWIFRVAGVLVLGLLLVLAYFLITGWWQMSEFRERRRGDIVKVEQTAPDGRSERLALQFGDVEALPGTDRMLLPVESQGDGDGAKFSSGSGYEQPQTRNLIFLDASFTQPHWLYPNNEQVIVSHDPMRACVGKDPAASAAPEAEAEVAAEAAAAAVAIADSPCNEGSRGPTQAVYLTLRRSDSNGDGELDDKDVATFAFVRPDGSGYTELAGAGIRVLERRIRGGAIGLLVQTGSRVSYRRYAIADFKQLSDTAVADLRR